MWTNQTCRLARLRKVLVLDSKWTWTSSWWSVKINFYHTLYDDDPDTFDELCYVLVDNIRLLLVRCWSSSVHNVHCKPEMIMTMMMTMIMMVMTMSMAIMMVMTMYIAKEYCFFFFTFPDTLLIEWQVPFQSQDLWQLENCSNKQKITKNATIRLLFNFPDLFPTIRSASTGIGLSSPSRSIWGKARI